MSGGRAIAIFDLDETITVSDTTLAFVFGVLRMRHMTWTARCRSFVSGIAAFARQRNKKNLLLGLGLAGTPRTILAAEGERFADRVIANGLRREALAAIEQHRADGDLLVLASASIDLYVEPIARRLGFDEVICTRTLSSSDGRLTARLQEGNCKGLTKARHIERRFVADDLARSTVYSDSFSDLPLMRKAARAFVICEDGGSRSKRATALGLATKAWR